MNLVPQIVPALKKQVRFMQNKICISYKYKSLKYNVRYICIFRVSASVYIELYISAFFFCGVLVWVLLWLGAPKFGHFPKYIIFPYTYSRVGGSPNFNAIIYSSRFSKFGGAPLFFLLFKFGEGPSKY